MKTFTRAALGLMLAAAVALPASAGNFVTKEQVDRTGGYSFALKDGSVARIVDVRAPEGATNACKVDIPSVQKLAQRAQDRQQIGHVPIRLRARADWTGNFFCYGEGTGCVVIVLVPSAHG